MEVADVDAALEIAASTTITRCGPCDLRDLDRFSYVGDPRGIVMLTRT